MPMPTAEVFTSRTFAEQMLTTAEQSGFETKINRNGVRQIDFANKSLTEEHLRLLFKDISRKGYVYSRAEADVFLGRSRPCAIAAFFDLAVEAGLACEYEENGKKLFRFSMARMQHARRVRPIIASSTWRRTISRFEYYRFFAAADFSPGSAAYTAGFAHTS